MSTRANDMTWFEDYDDALRVATRYARTITSLDPRDAAHEALEALRVSRMKGSFNPSAGVSETQYRRSLAARVIYRYRLRSESAVSCPRTKESKWLAGQRAPFSIEHFNEDTHKDSTRRVHTLPTQLRVSAPTEEEQAEHSWRARLSAALSRVLHDESTTTGAIEYAVLLDGERPTDVAKRLGVLPKTVRLTINRARARITCDDELFELWRELRRRDHG